MRLPLYDAKLRLILQVFILHVCFACMLAFAFVYFVCLCLYACSAGDCVSVCRCTLQGCVSCYMCVEISGVFCFRVVCSFVCACLLVLRVVVYTFAFVCCNV